MDYSGIDMDLKSYFEAKQPCKVLFRNLNTCLNWEVTTIPILLVKNSTWVRQEVAALPHAVIKEQAWTPSTTFPGPMLPG